MSCTCDSSLPGWVALDLYLSLPTHLATTRSYPTSLYPCPQILSLPNLFAEISRILRPGGLLLYFDAPLLLSPAPRATRAFQHALEYALGPSGAGCALVSADAGAGGGMDVRGVGEAMGWTDGLGAVEGAEIKLGIGEAWAGGSCHLALE